MGMIRNLELACKMVKIKGARSAKRYISSGLPIIPFVTTSPFVPRPRGLKGSAKEIRKPIGTHYLPRLYRFHEIHQESCSPLFDMNCLDRSRENWNCDGECEKNCENSDLAFSSSPLLKGLKHAIFYRVVAYVCTQHRRMHFRS